MPPRPKENVWNYPRPPALQPTTARLRVIWVTPSKQELVVAETSQGYRVLETSHPPTYYFPPSSVRADLIRPSKARRTMCEWKGMAAYHDLQFSQEQGPMVVGRIWSYPQPTPAFESIQDYLCFYATSKTDAARVGRWKCMVDDDEVTAQEGDFYGSWITPEITGGDKGFKGDSNDSSAPKGAPAPEPSSSNGPRNPVAAYKGLNFAETLEDLSSRFIVNLPVEEHASIERICFQVEQAHWFYEDFLRPLNTSLPSLALRRFSSYLLHASATAVPLIQRYITGGGQQDLEAAFDDFMKYKTRVPVCGAILLAQDWNKCLLVKGWKSSAAWGFPKGKINQDEPQRECAIREVLEETGYDCSSLLPTDSEDYLDLTMREQRIRLYIVPGVSDQTHFECQTRKEISKIAWFKLGDLPTWKKSKEPPPGMGGKFYLISPFIGRLKQWIHANKHTHPNRPKSSQPAVDSDQFKAQAAQTYGSPAAAVKAGAPASSAPAFPDPSSFFPTFVAGDKSQQKAAPLPAPPSSEKLKALLGLSAGTPEPAAVSDSQQRASAIDGVGSRMIEQGGDARGKELLDLLRGPGAPSVPQPAAPQPPQQHEQRAATLLAALNGGPAPSQQQSAPPAAVGPQALLNLLNGPASPAANRQAPPPCQSPLPAPRPQKTIQAQKLLQMIAPTGGHQREFSQSGSDNSPGPQGQHPNNAFAALLGGLPPQQQQQQHQSPPQANQQAQTLLQMLSPRQAEAQQAPLLPQYFSSQQPSHADIARLLQAVTAARDGSPGMANGPSQNDLLAILTGALGQQPGYPNQQSDYMPPPPPNWPFGGMPPYPQ